MNVPWAWDFVPGVVVCLGLVALIYAAGACRLHRERRKRKGWRLQAVAFGSGIGVLSIALLSPLDAWAGWLFAAHMTQHLILMMIAPPLLILGRPIAVGLWALPRGARAAVGARWRNDAVGRPSIDLLQSPLVAWVLATAALWFWHLPKPYTVAFEEGWPHTLEHLSFFFGGILFWRVVIEHPQSRRLSLGATMLFVATFAMQNGMLGALLVFAPRVLYAVHAVAPPWSPFTPLEDQQLAGVLMWFVTGAVDLGAMGLLFVVWLASSERRVLAT